jgi:hypothetical protein
MGPNQSICRCREIVEWQLRGTFEVAPSPTLTSFHQPRGQLRCAVPGGGGDQALHQRRDVDALGRPEFFAPNGDTLIE